VIAAAGKWWSSQFLLPGAEAPLTPAQQAAVTYTIAAWMDTVEELPADAAGTTAEHLQRAWAALLASGKVAPEHAELAQRAWRWRELLQRAMDGCDSTSDQRWDRAADACTDGCCQLRERPIPHMRS
jgi:hypothetical protein